LCASAKVESFEHKVSTFAEGYFSNWVTELDLVCFDQESVQHMLGLYIIASFVSSLLLHKQLDDWGCRRTIWVYGTI
jgi:uncharacterized membrane protein (DUF106 family)